jgi:hypothetical protein
MHATLQFFAFWVLAFLSLAAALVALSVFMGLIDEGTDLLSLQKEATVAAIASFIEAGSAWLILTFVPGAARAMIIPVLIVAFIYKVAHLEDWTRLEVFLLLVFQFAIGSFGVLLFTGHIHMALVVLVCFAGALAIIIAIIKSF